MNSDQPILGRPEQALETMENAFHQGYPPADAVKDPELKDFRSPPEFEKLVKEFGSKIKQTPLQLIPKASSKHASDLVQSSFEQKR